MREKWARRIALLTGLLVLLLAVTFAFTQNSAKRPSITENREQVLSTNQTEPLYLDPKRIEAGLQIYSKLTCARCHSIAGKGNPRNPLDDVGARHNAQALRDWITGADELQRVLPERAFKIKQGYKKVASENLDVLVIAMQSLRPVVNDTDLSKAVTKTAVDLVGEDGSCLSCHNNAGHLMQAVKPSAAPPEDGCAVAPSRPAFLNAFVNSEFTATVHGKIGCTGCHGGDAAALEKREAHTSMKVAESDCANCHSEQAELHNTSLHNTMNGMAHALKLRSGEDNYHKLGTVWSNDCASCHAGCSDCHLTLPTAVGGGLIKGHAFFKRPPMKDTCAVCHGSRAGAEYLGQWQGYEPDVHNEAGMHCLDCHKNDLHGDGQTYANRWQVTGRPQCTDCHAVLPNKTAEAHDVKHQDVSCQVCHAQPYQNCFSCHTSMKEGEYQRRAGHKRLDFKIGLNTVPGYPYSIVTLRNNPVVRNSFDHFGEKLLPHFDDYPTWKTAAPHNIRRVTKHNRNCDSCHGQENLFLQESDLEPHSSAANKNIIMPPARNLGQGLQY